MHWTGITGSNVNGGFMGLFGKKKNVSVTVHGNSSIIGGADGRYDKQARKNRKAVKQKEKELSLETHTTAELRGYIEAKYGVKEMERSDDRFKRAYMGIKAHLVFEYAPELVKTKEMPEPSHPPVSDNDPDYKAYRENEEIRWQEAVHVPPEEFPMHLHVYNISIMQGELPIAWLEVYVETEHEYLAFKPIQFEYEEHYRIDRIRTDIIKFFGAGPEDKKEKNERYLQLLSVQ